MIDGVKPYLRMKDSGVPWLGVVPEHWEVSRLGALLRERGEGNQLGQVSDVLSVTRDRGVIPYAEKGNIGNKRSDDITRYKIVRPNDIVVNCMNVIIGSVGLSRYTGCLSPVYYVLTRRSENDCPQYLNSYFQTRLFQESLVRIGNGILAHRMRIPMELLKKELFPRPPASEQAAIVRFLGHADRKIRRYIRAKQKLIKLLEEQKQAIIHRAVTRGLDPSVPLNDSGIPWLGEIPEHWDVRRVKHVARISRGKFKHRPRNDPSLYDGPYPFIQTGAVAQAAKFITSFKQTLNEKGLAVSKLFRSGTLVMTIAANIGDVAILTFDACFPDSIVGFTPSSDVDRDYLYLAFLCMRPELLREAPVNTQGNLNIERVGTMGIPLPPFTEQQRITEQVATETGAFTKSISSLEREINLLREYRTRLIADVVTGKLDVREAAAGLPEEIEPLVNEEPDDEIEDLEPEEDEGSELS